MLPITIGEPAAATDDVVEPGSDEVVFAPEFVPEPLLLHAVRTSAATAPRAASETRTDRADLCIEAPSLGFDNGELGGRCIRFSKLTNLAGLAKGSTQVRDFGAADDIDSLDDRSDASPHRGSRSVLNRRVRTANIVLPTQRCQ
jgi:hypothetical protein